MCVCACACADRAAKYGITREELEQWRQEWYTWADDHLSLSARTTMDEWFEGANIPAHASMFVVAVIKCCCHFMLNQEGSFLERRIMFSRRIQAWAATNQTAIWRSVYARVRQAYGRGANDRGWRYRRCRCAEEERRRRLAVEERQWRRRAFAEVNGSQGRGGERRRGRGVGRGEGASERMVGRER